ncbi:MAG: hypothetical protein MAG431_01798 [Chloroflexi bacterium]|nr:hypothetical protein [Chloroflexota bacterium]
MISILVVFWIFVFFFSVIGAFRGWVKELLVVFSVILALFLLLVLEEYLELIDSFAVTLEGVDAALAFSALDASTQDALRIQFRVRSLIIIALAVFGYQTPNISFISGKARREKVQDILFGSILGAVNGYLVVGSVWSFMASSHYLFEEYISGPEAGTALGDQAIKLVQNLPPQLFENEIGLFIAVGVSFLFVLVVFI